MKIGIIGATGKAGRAIATQALSRGHEATAIARNPSKATDLLGVDVPVLARNAFDLTAEDLRTFDVVGNAFATAPDRAHLHVSPSAKFEAGAARGVVLGEDELLVAGDGTSHTTTGTMAVAILDEIERPAHRQERFTVGRPLTLAAGVRVRRLP